MFHKNSKKQKHNPVVDKTLLAEIIHPVHSKTDPKTPYSLAHAELLPGEQSTPHVLTESIETYIIVNGSGEIVVDGEKEHISIGSVIVVPSKKTQYVRNTGESLLEFYCIVSPPWKLNNDHLVH